MNLFGFEFKRKQLNQDVGNSVITPTPDDGSMLTSSSSSYYGLVIDVDTVIKNENDLIRRYREISQYSDCESAIEEIVNEAIVSDPNTPIVSISLDSLQVTDQIKDIIIQEFDRILTLYNFDEKAYDIFRNWYIDGRIYYHVIVDEVNPQNGIMELRVIDPRKIRKITNIQKGRDPRGYDIVTNIEEYYLYNNTGITEQTTQGIRLSKDSIVYCTSGLIDANTNMVLSHLHGAIKPTNQLKMIEDALVIYRITRSSERRVFYIDVGNLSKFKAESYVNDLMLKYRNKMVYDAQTGTVSESKRHMAMVEDFWMPRREGGRGTEITTLPSGQALDNISDLEYFQNKLFQSLKVPLSRLQPQTNFTLGRSTEVSREEVKFNKFVERLRKKFSFLFKDALKIQLILKGIIRPDEWDMVENFVKFDFQRDNYFSELKESEIMQQRVGLLGVIDPYVGKYYSSNWVRKHILMQTEKEMEEMEFEMQQDQQLAMQAQLQQQEMMQKMGQSSGQSEEDPNEVSDTENNQQQR